MRNSQKLNPKPVQKINIPKTPFPEVTANIVKQKNTNVNRNVPKESVLGYGLKKVFRRRKELKKVKEIQKPRKKLLSRLPRWL